MERDREGEMERGGEGGRGACFNFCVSWTGKREQVLHNNVQWFRGGLVLQADDFFVSRNSRPERNKEDEGTESADGCGGMCQGAWMERGWAKQRLFGTGGRMS